MSGADDLARLTVTIDKANELFLSEEPKMVDVGGGVMRPTNAKVLADLATQMNGAQIYTSVPLGLSSTAAGSYFSVPSPESAEYLVLYQNSSGVAQEIDRYPNSRAIAELGVEDMDSDLTGLLYAVVGKNGERTSIEIGLDGKPTDRSAAAMGEKLTKDNAPALVAGAAEEAVKAVGFEEVDEALNDISFAVVDKQGSLTFLSAKLNGDPTADSAARILRALPFRSGPDIFCCGDSMTFGNQDGTGVTYPGELQVLLDSYGHRGTVSNFGVGGETSVTITARCGANPFIVMPAGGLIPGSNTAVELTLHPINGEPVAPLKQGPTSYIVTLAGVRGIFSRTVSGGVFTYFFTRLSPGQSIPVERPEPMYLEVAQAYRGDIAVIWMGQNGPSTDRAISDAEAIISHLTALEKRFVVISMPGGTSAQDADDAKWFAKFGRRFIPIRQYMVKYGLADAGITPTAQDIADMANGTVPTSLRTDLVHWKAAGYKILAKQVFIRMKELEFI